MRNGQRDIVVLDYPGRRAAASIASLGLESEGYTPWYLMSRHLPDEPTAAHYTASLYEHASPDLRVGAVMAYCAASALAGDYAALVGAASGKRPPVICFDAEPCTVRDLVECYAAALRQVPEGSDGAPPVDIASLAHQPHRLVETVREDLTRRMFHALLADGIQSADAESVVTRSVDIQVSWLTHLLACFDTRLPNHEGNVLNVLSRRQADHGKWLAGETASTVRIDCSRNDLLRHPETQSVVLSFLEEHLSPGSGDQ
ncbi:hypothetical protein A8W25_01225 [Streptomyces sp. ERV7]|uniref:hypothetical protein n=1 Tax=Streptomyces sp. ERV7 TaxID=1322334 RepID=UPI0007F46666|nr:hypothetical protein [Streptomyces sp. ERV7]OAR26941.1 hypothetical protein A8W25_01225 [Streptomyces sp. ERV7]